MPLPFRRRIFVVLVLMAAVPTGLAVVGWVLTVRTFGPTTGARASLEEVTASARSMLEQVDTTRLAPAARTAMREHLEALSHGTSLARRADRFLRYYTAGLATVVIALGTLVLFAAVRVAGHLSRQLSRPIDELIGWTRLIRQHEPLPAGSPTRGAPEFAALRVALRDMAGTLDTARARELEAERLRAFREVARRVAHEIKNPLTAMRIAVDQLGGAHTARTDVAVEVLRAETDRLERLAQEFADFGRLPEGPKSEVDVVELLEELGRTAVLSEIEVRVAANGRRAIQGHYEPLRRAFSNLFRNAAEAMGGRGIIDVTVSGEGRGVVVAVADHGHGIPPELRGQVFEPYVTTKPGGTGLGLALVRQTVDAHEGTLAVSETPGGGATFTLVFPA